MRPITERVPLGLDVARLVEQLEREVRPLPIVWQSEDYGGWSVLSRTGDHRDGWQLGHRAFTRDGVRDLDRLAESGVAPEPEYSTPTPLCTGAIADALGVIRARGLALARARIALLRAQGGSAWHRDGADGDYSVRLHVAIVTNPGCVFRTRGGQVHIPADGDGYLVNVAQMHEIVNQGDDDRVHLFMPVWDTTGVTRHFRAPGRVEAPA